MTTACYTPCQPASRAASFDILRGVGLAVSVAIILVAPAILAALAFIQG